MNSFDISFIDQATGLYFLADRSNKGIDIIDTKKGAFVGRVEGMVGEDTGRGEGHDHRAGAAGGPADQAG